MKKHLRCIIDIAMVTGMPLLMAYSLIGERSHEILGSLMFLLFISHHVMNRKWWNRIGKGRYTLRRILMTVINISLVIFMIAQPLSGILMSKYLYTYINIAGVTSTVREIHLCLAYWGFVLLSIHAGMHMGILWNRIKCKGGALTHISGSLLSIVFAYGIYAIIKRNFLSYMFLQAGFAFYDFSESTILFIFDYLTVMIAFAVIGCFAATGYRTDE